MPRFGWMKLAYLLFALTVLVSLARVGAPGAEARSLSVRASDAPSPLSRQRETQPTPRLTEDVISSLEDIQGSPGHPNVGPNIAEPRLSPLPDESVRRSTAKVPGKTERQKESADEESKAAAGETPVFYRPPDSGAAPDAGPVCGDLGGTPKSGRVVFPLEERFYYSYEDTWGAPRTQGGHEGTDLMTPSGVPEYAITDGTVVPVAGSDADGWNALGGYAVMVRADYSIGPVQQGDLFYYAHLEQEGALPVGARVQAGQVVGYAGDTGQGPPVTRGLFPPHLHLGWYDAGGTREEADSGAMNPYPLLEWLKANGGAVTGGSDARFCHAPGTAQAISPSADEKPASSGLSPDLDTGSNDPRPSPARSDAREGGPKPTPAAEKDAREQASPTKDPPRPNRPEQQPRRVPGNTPAKSPDSNRPETAESPKPRQPDPDPKKPNQSVPGQSEPPNLRDMQYDPELGAVPSPQAVKGETQEGEPTLGTPRKNRR